MKRVVIDGVSYVISRQREGVTELVDVTNGTLKRVLQVSATSAVEALRPVFDNQEEYNDRAKRGFLTELRRKRAESALRPGPNKSRRKVDRDETSEKSPSPSRLRKPREPRTGASRAPRRNKGPNIPTEAVVARLKLLSPEQRRLLIDMMKLTVTEEMFK